MDEIHFHCQIWYKYILFDILEVDMEISHVKGVIAN